MVTPEEWEGEKGNMKDCCSKGELNPDLLHEMHECWILLQNIVVRGSRLEQSVLCLTFYQSFTHPDWDDRYWVLELTYYYRTLDYISSNYGVPLIKANVLSLDCPLFWILFLAIRIAIMNMTKVRDIGFLSRLVLSKWEVPQLSQFVYF